MSKVIDIKMKQNKKSEDWVKQGTKDEAIKIPKNNKMKRLTIDIPEEWHRKMKGECVKDGLQMVDVLRQLIKDKFIK